MSTRQDPSAVGQFYLNGWVSFSHGVGSTAMLRLCIKRFLGVVDEDKLTKDRVAEVNPEIAKVLKERRPFYKTVQPNRTPRNLQ